MTPLPIDPILPQVVETLRGHPSLVLTAAPGAGKTTRVPAAIINADLLDKSHPHLIMLQPRRVAARAAAQRIADEQRWALGQQVGYHIRFEKRYGPKTCIRILTEAILTRILLDDPYLESIGCVILDEFHERNLHTDLALAMLREVQQTVRPDLKLLVMSATLEADPVAKFLGDAPVINIEGRLHPLDITYHPPRDIPLETHVARMAEEALRHDGDVLVFLPGVGEIERSRRALALLERQGIAVLPLHSRLDSADQQRALTPDPKGRRKIILATNIAETSLTIDGVRTVIDSGLARIASFDPDRGMDRLDLERISQASATQRAGRAARQSPGCAYRLWSQQEHKHLAPFNAPEVQRVDLAAAVLAVHAWGAKDARSFGWFEAPPEPMHATAEELLALLGALERGVITDLGRHMLRIPAHPRIARLLLSSVGTRLQADAVTLSAILADDSRTPADPLSMLHRPPPHLTRIRDQLAGIADQISTSKIENRKSKIENLSDLLLLAYPDRVARRRGNDPHSAIMVGGVGVRLATEALTPALARAELFLALDAHHDPRNRKGESIVHTATPLDGTTLSRLFPDAIHCENALRYDHGKEKVVALTQRLFHDLIVEEDPHGRIDPEAAGRVLAEALAPRARELFLNDEGATKLLARVALLRHHMPELNWPDFDEAQLRELLVQACQRRRSLAEFMEAPLADALRGSLTYPLDRKLDELAPETIQAPSGSRIRLAYALPPSDTAPPPPPVLAVRLQELFGWLDTPRIVASRVPVLLHLLSPGFKPMQITTDLRSFWSSAYFDVRKDLRIRYPKHKWPEDPLTATPENKGRRR